MTPIGHRIERRLDAARDAREAARTFHRAACYQARLGEESEDAHERAMYSKLAAHASVFERKERERALDHEWAAHVALWSDAGGALL